LRGPSGAKDELQKVPKIFEKRRVLALCARRVQRTCQHQECYFLINSSFRIVDNLTTPALTEVTPGIAPSAASSSFGHASLLGGVVIVLGAALPPAMPHNLS
jgi:hypothetical protein